MIAFTFAGTGGHVYPCIALAQELNSQSVYFIGSTNRKDSEIVLRHHYRFIGIPSSRKNPLILFKSFIAARAVLKANKTRVLVSAGGYLTFSVALAAKSLGIPVFLLEQNILPGRVNRYLSWIADQIFISFEDSRKYFPEKKTVLSGNPVRKYFLEDTMYGELAKIEPQLPTIPTVMVFGGSQGAQAINQLFLDQYDHFLESKYLIFHVTGDAFYKAHFQEHPFTLFKNRDGLIKIVVLPYFEKMDYLYQKSQLVICRSGATTLAELFEYQKPCLLIPYPYAKDNHQFFNAEYAVRMGLGQLLLEKDLSITAIDQAIQFFMGHQHKPSAELQNARMMISARLRAFETV